MAEAQIPIGQTVTLRSLSNDLYVNVDASDGEQLEARSGASTEASQRFVVEDAGGGNVLLRSVSSGNFAVRDPNDLNKMFAIGTSAGDPLAQFQWNDLGNNVVRFTNVSNGNNVRHSGAQQVLRANGSNTGLTSQFTWNVVAGPPPGPGIPNVPQTVGAMLADFMTDATGNDLNVRTVVLDYLDGYLYMDTRDMRTGSSNHTVHTWDISDPSNPVEAHRIGGQRGQHTSSRFLPSYRVNNHGDKFLNVSDPLNMFYEDPPGYTLKNRGTRGSYLLPYEYLSGGSTVEIWDARTGTTLAELNDHGFAGLAIPIGNLLIVVGIRGQSARAVATYDISDPSNPVFLDVIANNDPVWNDNNPAYEAAIWKHYVVIPNVTGGGNGDDCAFVDFSDPANLRHVLYMNGDGTYGTGLPGRTRYAQFQDNKMFLGCGIYDMTPLDSDTEPTLLDVHVHDSEYMLPLGNLYVSAENTSQGSIPDFAGPYRTRIFAHQAAPDTTPPSVGYHLPADGATNQHVKTRVGVVIHETLVYDSINPSTFRVFPVAGGADLPGTLNVTDKDIIVFTPDADLMEGTTYRVTLDGIQDAVGNIMTAYSFDFTTAGSGAPVPISISDVGSSPYPAPVNGTATLSVTATGGLAPLEYRWDFGDGTPVTDWSMTADTVSHTYASAGHYPVIVQIRDSSATPNLASNSFVVTVTTAPSGATPTKATQILCDEINRRVWCVNPDNDTITALHADTLAKIVEVPVGRDPRSIAQHADGNLWITCLDEDVLEIRNGTTGALLDAVSFHRGSRPHDVVFNRQKTYAFVSLKGNRKLVRIDPNTLLFEEFEAGSNPAAVAVSGSGERVLVNRFISPETQGEVRSFANADDAGMNFDQILPLVIDTTAADDGVSGRGLPNYLADVAIDPLGQFAYVSSKKDNILRGGFRDGLSLGADTTVRAIVSKINLTTHTEDFAARIDIDDRSQPTALTFSPLGDYLFVAMQGNNEIKVIDTFTDGIVASLPTGLAPQGLCFDTTTNRLFVKNLTDRSVTVHDLTDGLREGDFNETTAATVSTVASESFSAEVLLGKQVFYNAADPRMGFGYISCAVCHQDGDDDGQVWDFTDRGEGLRNTTNLRGRGGMAHGNVHWSANFDEIQDFEIDMVEAFGGTGFLDGDGGPHASLDTPNAGRSAELDAMAAYVASLGTSSVEVSPFRSANGSLTASATIGKELFEGTRIPLSGNMLSCVSCHDPSTNFTDSTIGNNSVGAVTLHDLGTIKPASGERLGGGSSSLSGIDTPTLLGLHAAAPYLHDGSAATLAAVFDQFVASAPLGQPGSAHDLSPTGYNLSSSEKNHLIAYLEQIDGTPETVAPPEQVFREFYELDASGAEDFLDWSDNGVANIFYFLFDLGDPSSKDVFRLNPGGSPASGLPVLTRELDGTFTYSHVRHLSQNVFEYTNMTSGDLVDWGDVEDLLTPYRPTSTSSTPLNANYEIQHLHFPPRSEPSYFRTQVEAAD
ncbi:MAG: Ig-like domain-containing protein [Verrucomicrobiota bacterium]